MSKMLQNIKFQEKIRKFQKKSEKFGKIRKNSEKFRHFREKSNKNANFFKACYAIKKFGPYFLKENR